MTHQPPAASHQLEPKASALPQSLALSEAQPNSLSELMSRDPESYSKQDRAAIIAALRADRARREAAETAAAASGRKRTPRAAPAGPAPSAKDLGL